jgi:hypothetical protein
MWLAQKGKDEQVAGEEDDALVVAKVEHSDKRKCGSTYGIVLHARVGGGIKQHVHKTFAAVVAAHAIKMALFGGKQQFCQSVLCFQ